MPDCTMHVEIERRDPCRSGETLSGTVYVEVEGGEVACRDLEVTCQWHADGWEHDASETVRRASLFEGTWHPGRTTVAASQYDRERFVRRRLVEATDIQCLDDRTRDSEGPSRLADGRRGRSIGGRGP